jgi:3-hydroxyacyl-CoA dehydrogenase/enoyl-CoA hydratase/3-hydroxybutyryl-CoA epimerase
LDAFLARADELAEKYGERFRATPWLRELAAGGGSFPA